MIIFNTGKVLPNMWMNLASNKMGIPTIPDEEDVEDEEMGVAETYADYMPTKCMLNKR